MTTVHPTCVRCGDDHHDFDGDDPTCGYGGRTRSIDCHTGTACPVLADPADDLAARAVTAIARDLNGRRGLGIDGLPEDIREDIIATWRALVASAARGGA